MAAESTLQEVDDVLQALTNISAASGPELAMIPGLSAVVPFLGLFQVVAKGVDLVAKATVGSAADAGVNLAPNLSDAVAAVVDHNTPGAPNAPALS